MLDQRHKRPAAMSHQKGRARVACKLCNLRRVKCDRTIDSACSNCQLAGTACELINSRRGRYPRTASRPVEEGSHISTVGSRRSPAALERLHSTDLLESSRTEITESPESGRRDSNTRYVSPSLTELAVQQDGATMPGRVVYMGDSANFKYVLHEVGDPFQTSQQHRFWGDNLQRSMLERLGQSTQSTIQKIREDDQKHLQTTGVFQTPSKHISEALIDSFWKYSYPAFPLFDWAPFYAEYSAGSISPLLLNAIFMVAVFHCPESVLHDAGFSSRYLASLTFYRRAKALYDSDSESDGVIVIQATILMSNWWGGPMEQKDTWYWLGIAASLAQSLGMHRSKSYDILPESSRKVWRRIWWVLYINDIHHAAVYGRPPHIHPKFCNIEPLHEEDFAGCSSLNSASSDYGVSQESKSYLIHLVDLISKVGDCLVTKLASTDGNEVADRTSYNKLLQWERTLSDRFRATPAQISLERGFWPALIQVLYCEYQIVFYRLLSTNPVTVGLESPIFQAAGKITRLLEDLLISGTLYNAPFTILPAIFASSLVCIMNIRKGSPNIRVVSEHRAHLAMQILHRFQDTWPIAIWTRHLLDCLLKIPSADQAQVGSTSEEHERHVLSTFPDSNQSNQEPHWQDNTRTPLHITDMGVVTGLSPPQSTSEGNVFHYEGSGDSRTSGFPIIFPFTNLFEDVGFSPDVYTGSML